MSFMIRIAQSLGRSHTRRQVSHDRPGASHRHNGFSLLEMLIVITIVGIAMMVAVPTFSSWREQRAVNSATKTLLSHLKQARVIAMAENRSVRLTFGANSYTYDDNSGSCGLCKPQTVSYDSFSSQLGLSINITPAEMVFSSRGTASAATITLATTAFSNQITINKIGRAYLQ